jgi:hypothetical protein
MRPPQKNDWVKIILMAHLQTTSLSTLPREILFAVFDYLTVGELKNLLDSVHGHGHVACAVIAYIGHMTRNICTTLGPHEKMQVMHADWRLTTSIADNVINMLIADDAPINIVMIRPEVKNSALSCFEHPSARLVYRRLLDTVRVWKRMYLTILEDYIDEYDETRYAIYLELDDGRLMYWDFTVISSHHVEAGLVISEEGRDYMDVLCGQRPMAAVPTYSPLA